MTTSHFSRSTHRTHPPPYCKSLIDPLPPFQPPAPPQYVQGAASLLDPDPLAYNDISAYFHMPRQGSSWLWTEELDLGHCLFSLTLERLGPGPDWRIAIAIPSPPLYAFNYTWSPVNLQLEPTWDSGLLTKSWYPGYDRITAHVLT